MYSQYKKQVSNIMVLSVLIFVLFSASAFAGSYNYISPEDLKKDIKSGEDVFILDIQVKKEFDMHHIKGAYETCAYPVKSMEDKAKLKKATEKAKMTSEKVVIVCPRGKGGAKRTYDFLKSEGVDEKRLFILEKGQGGWPYSDMLSK